MRKTLVVSRLQVPLSLGEYDAAYEESTTIDTHLSPQYRRNRQCAPAIRTQVVQKSLSLSVVFLLGRCFDISLFLVFLHM